MPRRSPPTALRLVQGPLPPRDQPRHTLPSIPRPVFHPAGCLPRGPSPAPRARRPADAAMHYSHPSPLDLNFSMSRISTSTETSPVSSTSSAYGAKFRGPWDHSRNLELYVDIDNILTVPKPVVVGT